MMAKIEYALDCVWRVYTLGEYSFKEAMISWAMTLVPLVPAIWMVEKCVPS